MRLLKKNIIWCVKILTFIPAIFFYFLFLCRVLSFKTCSILVGSVPGIFGLYLRQSFYKLSLKKCGKNLRVFWGAIIVYPTVEIGDNCTIEEHSIISDCKIGNDVIFAARVSVMSGSKHHDVSDISNTFYNSQSSLKKVILGDNLWIGTHAVIMNDVGSHCAIGAGAVVSRVIPEYSVAVGVPAIVIKDRRVAND